MSRADEIRDGLATVRERIARSCEGAGRDPDEVTLVVVTKFFPTSDVRILADLGVTDVGENRHQEAEQKAAELADLRLTWHFIGTLQSNKAAAVAQYADVVQSVDRPKLLAGLGLLVPVLSHVGDPEVGQDAHVGSGEELGDHDQGHLARVAADALAGPGDALAHRRQPVTDLLGAAHRSSRSRTRPASRPEPAPSRRWE